MEEIWWQTVTFPWYELVNFVRFFGFRSVKFFHFFDVWRFVEGTPKSSLELCIVWLRVSLTPSTRVLRPLLSDKLTIYDKCIQVNKLFLYCLCHLTAFIVWGSSGRCNIISMKVISTCQVSGPSKRKRERAHGIIRLTGNSWSTNTTELQDI